ncbi:MAG: glycosyltransferase family 2 protein [Candidatus Methylumidiphilus sp.]
MCADVSVDTKVFAVVVTFNRRDLLEKCICALQLQTNALQRIVVINNASTDDTDEWMRSSGLLSDSRLFYYLASENLGGAGGFAIGMQLALDRGAEWIWMMDDDAEPEADALERLMEVASETGNIYGSLAVSGAETAWSTSITVDGVKRVVELSGDVPNCAQVVSLPFLGFMIHRCLVEKIGLPDAGFFIAGDDAEYCMRAAQVGAEIIIVGTSRINHPKSERYFLSLPGRRLVCLRLPPWKRYYDTRNRLLIAKRHYGRYLLTQTIPSLLLRLCATLLREPCRAMQLWAFMAGFIDGLLGLKGRRHALWGISL